MKTALLIRCEVKIAGYWPSSFFLRVCGLRPSQVHKLAKNTSQYLAILAEQGFIIWLSGTIFFRDTAGSPERERSPSCPHRVFDSPARFGRVKPLLCYMDYCRCTMYKTPNKVKCVCIHVCPGVGGRGVEVSWGRGVGGRVFKCMMH